MVSTFQHFELVRLAEFMEVYGVARNSYRDVGVEFGVFHSLYEFFAVDNVYVKVMRALGEVTVQHVYEVVYALFFVFAERGRSYREGIRNAVAAVFVRNLGNRVKRSQRAACIAVIVRAESVCFALR